MYSKCINTFLGNQEPFSTHFQAEYTVKQEEKFEDVLSKSLSLHCSLGNLLID